MTSFFTAILALFIAAYGLLLIVGGPPRLSNKLPRALGRAVLGTACGLLRGLIQLTGAVLDPLLRFVFDRPRR